MAGISDVLNSFVQTAGSAFQTYESAQAPHPFMVPPGATVGTTPSGQTFIQQGNTTMWLIIGVAVIAIVILLFLKR